MKKLLLFILLGILLLASTALATPPGFGSRTFIFKDTNCNQAKYQMKGILCHDTADNKIYYWNGSAMVDFIPTSGGTLSSVTIDLGDAVASGHAVTMNANGELQTAFTALLPDANDGATLGSSSYAWSDLYLADGAKIYIAAEELTFTATSTTQLTVSSGSGITDVSFSALNLATTGTITGAIKINSDSNGMSSAEMTTAGMYGTFYLATGAGTWNLPGAAAGMSFCIYSTTAAAVVINPDDGDVITLNGTALTAGDSITSASAAGDFICLVAADATNWYTLGRSGTWTDTN